MNFNTILLRFGIDPDNFKNQDLEPIQTETGFIYEAEQRTDIRQCPNCGSHEAYINAYFFTETRCTSNEHLEEILRIKKVRFKCKKCHITYTPPIKGIERYGKISKQVQQFIYNDFTKSITFSEIARRYNISLNRIIDIFDDKVKFVPRREMPRVLCIDEIRFSEEINQKFVCVLYDFDRSEIVDIIKNRQMPYLNEYFVDIPLKERNKVQYVISDMYDAYATIKQRFFPKAVHIVDLFHVVTQLTNAVNRIRTNTMNMMAVKGTPEYNFMKQHWKYFLCRRSNVPDKFYVHKKTGVVYHYDDIIHQCTLLNQVFLKAYYSLQDLYRYSFTHTYDEALTFIEWLAKTLKDSSSEILQSVGRTYHKWRFEIASAFSKSQNGIKYTNAIAESINNQLKTIIKAAYGYRNFDRFRRRAMLIITYSKPEK